ncbi:response regulator [Chitinophaga silvatica]|uniref:histidine kinase n=1 Tax=Chitinophaga silvatica TaxID=2282649 RepID=A0A3E1Y3S0_9BACT|nr:two-component regulator propeller domain-containing protein [Chitinophaga silvatica]RFS19282.1 response regulator [Chitinophaga silvatica]
MFRILVILASFAYSSVLFAQTYPQQFESIDHRRGLSSNQINCIAKDASGFVWFGTLAGLNRFDGYTFRVFRHKPGDTTTVGDDFINQIVPGPHQMLWVQTPNGWNIYDPGKENFIVHLQQHLAAMQLPNEEFSAIVPDAEGCYWFIVSGKGAYRYNPSTRKSIHFTKVNGQLYSDHVSALSTDHRGNIWIAYTEGVLDQFNKNANQLIHRTTGIALLTGAAEIDYKMFIDPDNDVWLYKAGQMKGLFYFQSATGKMQMWQKDKGPLRLNNDIINGITVDNNNRIWIATDHGGVNIIDKKNGQINYVLHSEREEKSLAQNSINAIYKDDAGIIWLGSFKKGVNYYHESSPHFPLFQHHPNLPSLPFNDVNRFVEDHLGNLWIGTNGGGLLYYDRAKNTFKRYLYDPAGGNVIVSLLIDRQGKLWIGTYYGGLYSYDGRQFTNYRHQQNDPNSLADDRIWELYEDSNGVLWVGTLSEGVLSLDRKTGKFTRYKPSGNKSNYIAAIMEDKQSNIWLGTSSGIDVLDKHASLLRHFEHIENDKASLSNNIVTAMVQDSRGLTWIATNDGLNWYNPATKTFNAFRQEEGLPDNVILTLLEDDDKQLWVSTPNGLSRITVTMKAGIPTLKFRNFDETDGLQGRQFNENAALKTKNGELVFGGANGFNIFKPTEFGEHSLPPKVILTGLQLFNQEVQIGKPYNGRIVLPESIAHTKELVLKYNQNIFAVEFAALGYLNAHKTRYAYRLEGFSDDWLVTDGNIRKATFTNLNPGKYTLLVKAAGENGDWSTTPLALNIRILPPWWLTEVAIASYIILLIASFVFGRYLILRRAKANFRIQRERQEARQLHELDMMKIRFFTNVSHEFRTPLSLIISPIEKMLSKAGQNEDQQQFKLIHRNARRLLILVNQLLDFRKLEEQELKLHKSGGDIIGFIREAVLSFSDLAENKGMKFTFSSNCEQLFTAFDHDKIERVVFNLLSNAFKFTFSGGSIDVLLTLKKEAGSQALEISVKDTGIGISKDKQEQIFERFFQSALPNSLLNQGSGIGLSITKEFVRLHGGTISVSSELNVGSCFTVSLPVNPISEINILTEEIKVSASVTKPAEVRKPVKGKLKTILLVEDNEDFRFYIKDNLKEHFNIIEAGDGKAGWQKALSEHPDLIVSDISMPEMNGIDLCRKIREDSRTHFIPLILLTAMAGEQQQLEGLQTGASDYITKPFNAEILISKISNLLSQQEAIRKTYQKQVKVEASVPEKPEVSSEEDFVKRALAYIEQNIGNADLSVEDLSKEMCMSRAALYKKMFSLTGQAPAEFIRNIRLQRALHLLEQGGTTVAEVAYQVGFNNPKYFARYFKEVYHVLPSTYLDARKRNNLSS